jgi:hypothetical protein
MDQEKGLKLEALERVIDFLSTNAAVLGAIVTSAARQEIDAAIASIKAQRLTQSTARNALVGQMNVQLAAAEQLVETHMQAIKKFAMGKLRGIPEFAKLTVPVSPVRPKQLLTAARTMANTAAPYADQFTAAGMASNTVDRLTAAADTLEAAMTTRSHLKGVGVQATRQIDTSLRQGRDAVLVIDGAITQLLPVDHPLLAAWKLRMRVELKSGKTRGANGETPTPTPTPGASTQAAQTPTPPQPASPPVAPVNTTPAMASPAAPKSAS